jgi:coproporphyrinogen III oxidase-like Fe-S oxidoreductase
LRLYDCFEQTLPPQLNEQVTLPGELRPLTRERVLEFWNQLLRQRADGRASHLVQGYLHVPFCRTKCRFCQFPSEILRDACQLETFVNAVEQEMEAFKAALGPVPVDCLAIGGGTPSLLSPAQLVRVLSALRTFLSVPAGAYFSVECNPDSTTRTLVDVLADHDVTRVSLGVQSFDTDVLRQVGRGYQTKAHVAAAVNAIRQRGLAISLDLIAPLPGETSRSFAAGVQRAIELAPDMIVLYWFQPTGHAALNQPNSMLERNQARDIALNAASAGRYDVIVQSGPSLVLKRADAPEPTIRYQQRRAELSSTLGFGPFAWSHVARVGEYVTLGGVDGSPNYHGVEFDDAREARSAIARQLETTQRIDRRAFRETFGQDPVTMLPAEMDYLSEARRVTVTEQAIEASFADQRDARRYSWVLFDERFIAAALAEAALPARRAVDAAVGTYEKLTGVIPRPRIRELQRHFNGSIAPIETSVCVWHQPRQMGSSLEVWIAALEVEPHARVRTLVDFQNRILPPALQPVASVVSQLDACHDLARIGVELRAETGDSVSLRLRFAAPPSRWLGLIDTALGLAPLESVSPELLSRMAELRLCMGTHGTIRREGVFLLNANHACLHASPDKVEVRLLADLVEAGAVLSLLRTDGLAALEIDVPANASALLSPILTSTALTRLTPITPIRGYRLRIAVLGGHLNWHSIAVATVA